MGAYNKEPRDLSTDGVIRPRSDSVAGARWLFPG
jgi:hypothetical protein